MAVELLHLAHFSTFNLKHMELRPAATTQGCSQPLFPSVPQHCQCQLVTLHHILPSAAPLAESLLSKPHHASGQEDSLLQLRHRARGSPKPLPAPLLPLERGAGMMPRNMYITQPGSHPEPISDHSRAHHDCKLQVHKSQPAQSIKSAHSNNFMGKMDSWQVRGCCHSGWMPVEGRAELWSSRDKAALPGEPSALPSPPCRAAQSSGTLLGGSKGAIPKQDKALWCCLREQSIQVVPGTGKMIREQEHRVPEQSVTFTNHQVWRGRKDRSRLAAELSHAAGTAQQVPLHCQPSTQHASSSPAVGQGRAGAMVQPPALAGILGRVC